VSTLSGERDYILGTHDEEVERLGLQHRVWRPRAADAWRRAGFTTGWKILDIGAGPGHATLDLAQIVGPSGRVWAVERSRRFLAVAEARAQSQDLRQIDAVEADLDLHELPSGPADGAWVRWVFAFVKNPRRLLERITQSLRPGGVLVVHEYLDYSTWKMVPRLPELEEFVQAVMKSWRSEGGEPDIGVQLPVWLVELGYELKEVRPLIEVASPSSYWWQWPKAFVEVGVPRMVDLGHLTSEKGQAIRDAFARAETQPGTLIVTPLVIEIVAAKRC
jgi:SAM-dependent methyltransferase